MTVNSLDQDINRNNGRVSRRSVHVRTDITSTIGFGLIVAIMLLTGFVAGCSRPNPTPEKSDPIYQDLLGRSAVAKAAAESAKEEIKKLKKDLEELPARDPSRSKLIQDLRKKELHLVVADQEALYYEVRSDRRKEYARREYLEAYNKGQPWPDPKDFETYKLQKKLEDSPREWNSRLQKTDRYNKQPEKEMRDQLEEKLKTTK